MSNRKPVPGDEVVMVYTRFEGRKGRLMQRVLIPAGGAGSRDAYWVHLYPTARARGRDIRCNFSSFRVEGQP